MKIIYLAAHIADHPNYDIDYQEQYIIKPWVCDYGIYDTKINEFVSIPLGLADAKKVLKIYKQYLKGVRI